MPNFTVLQPLPPRSPPPQPRVIRHCRKILFLLPDAASGPQRVRAGKVAAQAFAASLRKERAGWAAFIARNGIVAEDCAGQAPTRRADAALRDQTQT